ncbi:MAG: hypothetical protein AB7O57_20100 [Hyphomicrobiaceae bacterium]
MKHRLIAQLDRQLRLRGESLQLLRSVSGATRRRVNFKGIVKTNGQAQLIAGITAPKYIIVTSPTELKRQGWSQGLSPVTQAIPPTVLGNSARDYDLPTNNDNIVVRQNQLAVTRVDPIYEGDVCVRIEMQVSG